MLCALKYSDFHQEVGDIFKDFQSNISTIMRKFEVFSNFTEGKLQNMSFYLKEIECKKGKILYREGDKVLGVYFLV